MGIDRKLIFSTAAKQPGKALGDVYSYTDPNLKTGRSYTYWLEIVLKDGSVLMLEPTTVQLMKLKPSQSFWKP